MEVRIEPKDWMDAMGIVGLHNIVNYGKEHDLINDDDASRIQVEQDALKLDPFALSSSFAKAYFEYLVDQHNVAQRDKEYINEKIGKLSDSPKEEQFREVLDPIKKKVNEQTDKIIKYYGDTAWGEVARFIKEDLKQVKKTEHLDKLQHLKDRFFQLLDEPTILRKLTTNYFKTTIMQPFFGLASFLQASANNLSYEEQIERLDRDYIEPVLLEAHLQKTIQEASDAEDVRQFLDKHLAYQPFKKLKRAFKKKSLDEIKRYIHQEALPCTLVDGQLATLNYEEKVFTPLGVSQNKALNFQWDMNKDLTVPLSALGKFILFCASAGAAVYHRKDSFDDQGKNRIYMGFVYTHEPLEKVIKTNDNFQKSKKEDMPFGSTMSDMVQHWEREAQYVVDNFLFIEFSSDYRAKRTLLDFYHLPPYLVDYFNDHAKQLDSIQPREYREAFIRQILKGEDPRQVITRLIRQSLKKGYSGWSGYLATKERYRLRQCAKDFQDKEKEPQDKEGGSTMNKEKERQDAVWQVYCKGEEIRKQFKQQRPEGVLDDYVASAEKKINGLAYRLLNAANANNRKSFMDTLLRLHMSVRKPVPAQFLDVLHERRLDFYTVANAFITGLLSERKTDKKQKQGVDTDE